MKIDIAGEIPSEPPELAGIAKSYDSLEKIRKKYSRTLGLFTRFPAGLAQSRLEKVAEEWMSRLEDSITSVVKSNHPEREKAEMIIGLIGHDYDTRQRYASRLLDLPHETVTEDDQEFLAGMVEELIEDSGDSPTEVADTLLEGISEDFNEQLEEIVERAESTRIGRMVAIAQTAGRHTLHMAETAGSVAGGLWIYEHFVK